MDEPKANVEFEQAWIQLSRVISGAATLKEIAELFFMKGRCVGMDETARHCLAKSNNEETATLQ